MCEFKFTSYEFKSTSCEFKVTSYEFKFTSYELKSTSYEFKSTSYEFKFTSYEFKFMSYEFKPTSSRIIKLMKTQVNKHLKQPSKTHFLRSSVLNCLGNSYVEFLVIISCFTFPLLHGYGFNIKLSE